MPLCCHCKMQPRFKGLLLCEDCVQKFRENPAGLKSAPLPERPTPKIKGPKSSDNGGAGVSYRVAGSK